MTSNDHGLQEKLKQLETIPWPNDVQISQDGDQLTVIDTRTAGHDVAALAIIVLFLLLISLPLVFGFLAQFINLQAVNVFLVFVIMFGVALALTLILDLSAVFRVLGLFQPRKLEISRQGIALIHNKRIRFKIERTEIDQLYLKKIEGSNQNRIAQKYSLWVVRSSGGEKQVLNQLSTPIQAFWLEQAIEAILDIKDKRISNEYQYKWRKIADDLGLVFKVTTDLPMEQLSGEYRDRQVQIGLYRNNMGNVQSVDFQVDMPTQITSQITRAPHHLIHACFHENDMSKGFSRSLRFSKQGTLKYEEYRVQMPDEMMRDIIDFLVDFGALEQSLRAKGGQGISQFCTIVDMNPGVVKTAISDFLGTDSAPSDKLMLSPGMFYAAKVLLERIAANTHKLQPQLEQYLCQDCLTRVTNQTMRVGGLVGGTKLSFYGCRQCQQSTDLFVTSQVVAALDNGWSDLVIDGKPFFIVNVLKRDTLVDFDEVYIRKATEQEIERYLVRVGNDTDPFRRAKYKQMACTIAPKVNLSDNTRRLLKRTFGQIKDATHAIDATLTANYPITD